MQDTGLEILLLLIPINLKQSIISLLQKRTKSAIFEQSFRSGHTLAVEHCVTDPGIVSITFLKDFTIARVKSLENYHSVPTVTKMRMDGALRVFSTIFFNKFTVST